MKHKVSELEGALLDAAVALTEVFPSWAIHTEDGEQQCFLGPVFMDRFVWSPSSAWEQGGPIIERERIGVEYMETGKWAAQPRNESGLYVREEGKPWPAVGRGPTPLIAAMRAYVSSKFGEEVDL